MMLSVFTALPITANAEQMVFTDSTGTWKYIANTARTECIIKDFVPRSEDWNKNLHADCQVHLRCNISFDLNGGGVPDAGTFTLYDGLIAENNAIDGGVFAEETFFTTPVFNLNGGTITGNTASHFGGVYIHSMIGNMFYLSGGTVSGNTAAYAGDNIDLCENHNIKITGSLGDHVYEVALTDYRGDCTTGVFTDGLSGKGTAANVTNGNGEKYILTLNDDGEAELVFNSAHYEEDRDTVILHDATGRELFCDLLEQNEYGYYTGKTVKMGDSFTITRMAGRFGQKFTGIEEPVEGQPAKEMTVDIVRTDSGYIARIRNIAASDLQKNYIVTVINGETVLGTITYSTMNYCYKVLHGGTTNNRLINVAKALYAYSQAAFDYFGKEGE